MKKLLTLIVLTSIHLSSLAQNEVFRIDSIPSTGILLDKGWKWHAGDNPDFAKTDFDDSKWERIDPTKDVMDLKQFEKNNIGWFRLSFKVDSSLFGQTFAIAVKQTGSSRLLINGNLIKQIGEFSTLKKPSIGFDPAGTGFRLTFGHSSNQVIAIKFEKPDIFLLKHFLYNNHCLNLIIVPVESTIINYEKNNDTDLVGINLGYFKSGLYLVIAFLHLWLFLANKKFISNLILCFWSFSISILYSLGNYSFYPIPIELRNTVSIIILIFHPILHFAKYYALYELFSLKYDLKLKITFFLTLLSIVFLFAFYDWGYLVGMVLIAFLTSLQITAISWREYKKGDFPAKFITYSEIVWLVFTLILFLFKYRIIEMGYSYLWAHFFYNIGFLFIALSLVYYFAYHFNQNRKNLQNKLIEVEALSQEKQNTLLKQNTELQAALLQGQTIERKRVAADLHDSLGSTMSSLIYTVNAIDTNHLDKDEKNVYQHLKQMLDTAYNEIRLLSHNLLPEEFEKQGLAEALRHFVRKINQTKTIQFDLTIDSQLGRLSPKTEFELYSICLELINNILKHAHATKASVDLAREQNQVKLFIADNGRGFFDNDSDGKGMKNVKARVESLNGTWQYDSKQNTGTSSTITIPL